MFCDRNRLYIAIAAVISKISKIRRIIAMNLLCNWIIFNGEVKSLPCYPCFTFFFSSNYGHIISLSNMNHPISTPFPIVASKYTFFL